MELSRGGAFLSVGGHLAVLGRGIAYLCLEQAVEGCDRVEARPHSDLSDGDRVVHQQCFGIDDAARHQVIVAGHARVFLEQARKMVDTKPRAGGQILDRETLGAVVVDVGAQLCKAAHVVLLLGVIQHLLAVLAVLIPPEDREKVQHQGHDLALTADVRAEILALYLRQHRKQLVGQFGVLLPGDKAEGVERVEQLGHVLYLMKVRYAVVHDVSLPRFGCANAVQLARCDNQHIMGLQRHGLARNRNRVGALDGGDDLARGMPVQWEIGVLHVAVKADRR